MRGTRSNRHLAAKSWRRTRRATDGTPCNKKIFVVLEPQLEEQPALLRASYLAESLGADLHLCAYDKAIGIASFLSGSQRDQFVRTMLDGSEVLIERLAAPLRDAGLTVTTEVVWDRHLLEAIIKALATSGVDLVVKMAREHARVQEVIFNHVDWNLMRYSPAPVMLVKNGQWDEVGQVLATVHPAPPSALHEKLNDAVMQTSSALARTLDFELHIASAYPAPPVFVPIARGAEHLSNYRLRISQLVERNVGALATEYDVPAARVHLAEGPVDWVISQVSQHLIAEFVVMGNVARDGIAGVSVGTSAEQTLDRLNTNVLLVPAPD